MYFSPFSVLVGLIGEWLEFFNYKYSYTYNYNRGLQATELCSLQTSVI